MPGLHSLFKGTCPSPPPPKDPTFSQSITLGPKPLTYRFLGAFKIQAIRRHLASLSIALDGLSVSLFITQQVPSLPEGLSSACQSTLARDMPKSIGMILQILDIGSARI